MNVNDNSALSATHHRLFSSLILVVENELFEFEQFMQRPDHTYVISKWDNNLEQEEIAQLRNSMKVCYERMKPFVQHFSLPEKEHDLRNALETKISFLWETLEDSKSKRMKGSVALNSDHQLALDSFLDDMIVTVNSMMKILDKN